MLQVNVQLSLFHDEPSSEPLAQRFVTEDVLARLHRIGSSQPADLSPATDPLVGLGTEIDQRGQVTKNSYGVFDLSWQIPTHPEWPSQLAQEIDALRSAIKEAHGVALRFVIWAGMGGSAEDKAAYQAAGLLKRGPRLYILDSTDPVKLQSILAEMTGRTGLTLNDALRSTLVVGMALGMTSYEPVINLEKLAALYEKCKVEPKANFVYLTPTGSLLDRFAAPRGFRRVELQLDNGNTTAGRHSSPLTRGSLYPLAIARHDLWAWLKDTVLTDEQIQQAWRLAAFLHTQIRAGRDKITLLLPKPWRGAGIWTKQDFEESLGKSERFGCKIYPFEKVRLADYHPPKDPEQDRVFLAIQIKGDPHTEAASINAIRRAGYPLATVTFPKFSLARYMQFIHYAVFGIGYAEQMNFVTQPSVELYKSITSRLYESAQQEGGLEETAAWQQLYAPGRHLKWRNGISLHWPHLDYQAGRLDAPAAYRELLRRHENQTEYAELTFFGDLRYSLTGRALRKTLDRIGDQFFLRSRKLPVDVYEGPAMNHSYHEMIIGHGHCFSTILLNLKTERFPGISYTPDYHRTQFLATQQALADRRRPSVAILLRDLEPESLAALAEFFREGHRESQVRSGRPVQ